MKITVIFFFTLLTIKSNAQRVSLIEESELGRIFVRDAKVAEKGLLDVEKKNYRLPESVYPKTYRIILRPTFEGHFLFYGTVIIEAKVVEKTDRIVLHYTNLGINEYHVYNNGKELKIVNATYDDVTDKFSIVLETYLLPQMDIQITFDYAGLLNDDIKGFYKSSFYDAEGNRRWLATTQLKPTHARRAFPCFDEPAFKARFFLAIIRPEHYTALTNMPIKLSQERNVNEVIDVFEPTPIMSTYSVAIVVTDFKMLKTNTSNVEIWAQEKSIHTGLYALQFGTKILEYFGNLFDQVTPVPKTAMVAIPDFAAGAVESWGLITYRENYLLHDNIDGPINVQQSIASKIAHECAHMWFGNLVSPKWWEFTWLSEGLSNYFQYMGTAKIEPTWNIDEQHLLDTVHTALLHDSYVSSTPLSKSVYSQEEIGSMFQTITYTKGGSIIRMMEMSFGSEIFIGALKEYIAKNELNNVESDDLWEALQNQVNRYYYDLNTPVKDLMHNWINEPGYPVLFVDITKHKITLSQRRFLLDQKEPMKSNLTWHIPITFTSWLSPNFNSTIANMWINETIDIPFGTATNDWIIFNNLGAGFYRVNYDTRSWYRIIAKLNSETFEDIHKLNRASIINDLMYLARAEIIDYEVVLDALQYIQWETDYVPFKAALNGLEYLTSKFSGQKDYDLYAKHVLKLIEKPHKKIGFLDEKNDDTSIILLRQELNSLACKLGHRNCIDIAKKIFANWRQNVTNRVPKNQRSVVYCYALKEGSTEDWEFLRSQYLTTYDASSRLVVLKSLGCTRYRKLLEKYLISAMTDFDEERQIHKQDSSIPFSTVASSGFEGSKYMLSFLAKNFLKMVQHLEISTIRELIVLAARSHTTQDQINSFQQYIHENPQIFAPTSNFPKAVVDYLEKELKWYNNNSGRILQWLYKTDRHD